MKRLSIILLALALTLTMIVPALAIHIGDIRQPETGTLGINGTYVLDGEKLDFDGDESAWYDNDVDVNFTWTLGDITLRWRAELDDFEGIAGGSHVTNIVDDLWMTYKVNDDLTLKIGEFFIGSSAVADDTTGGFNVQVMYGLDAVDLAFAISKEEEDGPTPDADGDEDTDRMVFAVSAKEAGPLTKLNLTYIMEDNQVEEEGATFTLLEVAAPLGPVTFGLQYGTFGGTDATGDRGYTIGDDAEGNYVLVDIGLDELVGFDLALRYFQSTDDLYPNWEEDYAPYQIIQDDVTFPESNANMTVIGILGGYNYSDKLSFGAAYVMANLTDDIGTAEEIGTEIDVMATYKLADNVTYKVAMGSFSDGDLGFGDITKYFNRLTVGF